MQVVLPPKAVHESRCRDDSARLAEEEREHRALLRAAEACLPSVDDRLERAEEAVDNLHRPTLSPCPDRLPHPLARAREPDRLRVPTSRRSDPDGARSRVAHRERLRSPFARKRTRKAGSGRNTHPPQR